MPEKSELIYPELSYSIIGALFAVDNKIGYRHKEAVYQKALANEFAKRNIVYAEQEYSPINYDGKNIGKYFFDFLVDGKIVVELKTREYFLRKDIQQIYSYLKNENLQLGILAHFTRSGIRHKRIVNIV